MTRTALAMLTAGTMLLSGCGGGEEAGEDPTEPAPAATATSPAPATEPPAEPTEQAAEERTHRVREGDTLSEIAQQFNTTVRAIARLNDIEDPHDIRIGQRLKIPAGD